MVWARLCRGAHAPYQCLLLRSQEILRETLLCCVPLSSWHTSQKGAGGSSRMPTDWKGSVASHTGTCHQPLTATCPSGKSATDKPTTLSLPLPQYGEFHSANLAPAVSGASSSSGDSPLAQTGTLTEFKGTVLVLFSHSLLPVPQLSTQGNSSTS